ncbi:uncharacterized protein LOC130701043 [Daphnia carinata]|uniref:uncharacterized protein LOC130701043 n=1 Tax=Daphnia carinata TaxID=120202 RepID=UPI00257BC257|nr:uncharacterized protein LOC130701043 [Daphnia carinata]
MISTTSVGPRSATQRKRQRLDQLVGRIAHLVGSAPIGRITSSANSSGCGGPVGRNKNRNGHNNNNNGIRNSSLRNNNNNSGEGEVENIDQRGGRICVSLSEEEEEEEDDDDDDDDEEEEEEHEDEEEEDEEDEGLPVSVSMESSVGSGESPSPQQQALMSRLRVRGNLRHIHHQHLHPHQHSGGQVFSFDHVVPSVMSAAICSSQRSAIKTQSDEEGEEEVFSPGLGLTPSFSDRLTLSPCSQSSTTVDSPSGISFSPLSFAAEPPTNDDPSAAAANAFSRTRSLTASEATPLNLSTCGVRDRGQNHHFYQAVTPPHASSSPFHHSISGLVGQPLRPAAAGVSGSGSSLLLDVVEPSNRRRARSDSDLCNDTADRLAAGAESLHHHVTTSAAPASWVLTPAMTAASPRPQSVSGNGGNAGHGHHQQMSRLEHLRPPPLMVSLKRNSSDSTDSWSPLFGQQESPVDLSVRSGSSVSSDSPNQTSTNTSTASVSSSELLSAFSSPLSGGLETPPPSQMTVTSSRLGKSRGSRLKVLTRSLSLSQYLSAEYLSSSVDLSGPDSETVSPIMAAPLLLPGVGHLPGATTAAAFGCDICGQIFDQHDRLVKHLMSRHKLPVQLQRATPTLLNNGGSGPAAAGAAGPGPVTDSGVVVKGYQCDVCQRPFARSDMLTRHMRLHTGLKPYTCRICGQVFSRSDHLSTHQRTHTGEKPYRCPQCSYAACRRDMITRHLRTHTRSEDLDLGHVSDPRCKDSG